MLDNEQLIAGLALAAERLRAQAPADDEAAPEPSRAAAPEPSRAPAPAPLAEARPSRAVEPVPEPEQPAAEQPWAPRPGGLVERIGRAFRRRS